MLYSFVHMEGADICFITSKMVCLVLLSDFYEVCMFLYNFCVDIYDDMLKLKN